MESNALITATYVLAGFRGILALATVAYVYTTWKLYKGSQSQIGALDRLTGAVLQLPRIAEDIKEVKEFWKQREEEWGKDKTVVG